MQKQKSIADGFELDDSKTDSFKDFNDPFDDEPNDSDRVCPTCGDFCGTLLCAEKD